MKNVALATMAVLLSSLLTAAAAADTLQFSLADYPVAESVGNATITVERTGTGTGVVSVQYVTVAGTAKLGDDFGFSQGTLTFADGELSRTFSVPISNDGRDEPAETVILILSNPQNATLGTPSTATLTILDDDPLQLIINDVSVSEEDSGIIYMTFTVALTDVHTQDVTFDWITVAGTATEGVDYQAASAINALIPAGQQYKEVTLNVIADTVDELDETLTVVISDVTGGVMVYDGVGQGAIIDDDAPCIRIRDAEVIEPDPSTGNTVLQVEVYLSDLSGAYAVSAQPVTVDFTTAEGSATFGSDYSSPGGQVTIPAGTTSVFVPITIIADLDVEGDEDFFIDLDNPINAWFCDDRGQVWIRENDVPGELQFSAPTYSVSEAGTIATITVVRVNGIGGTVGVEYGTANGSATSGSDYSTSSGTLTFAPGVTSQTFTVAVTNDLTDELDETVNLSLSNPTGGATLGSPTSAVLTITDDDPSPYVTVGDISVIEGNSGTTPATLTITLDRPSNADITVTFGTADGTATAGADYDSATGSATVPAGATSVDVTIQVRGDLITEGAETFNVNLSGVSAGTATIADNQGVVTITDDEAAPQISINDISFAEGTGGFTVASFTVTLSNQSQQTISVAWATAAGTATAGTDYATASGTVTFNPGVVSQTFDVSVFGDAIDEADETFFANLSSPVNATIADGQGQATIVDDEGTPAVSIGDASVTEGDAGFGNATFTVTLSGSSAVNVTVNYATANGTAVAPGDFTSQSGTLTFVPGVTVQTVNVPVAGDLLDELDETFTVSLSGASNANIADGTGLGTILDNDSLPAVSIDSVSAVEGANATFTISLSASSGQAISVNWATADGSAVAPGDYVAASGTANFAPGTTSQQILISTVNDLLDEANETFSVALSNPVNAGTSGGAGVGTIDDNDPLPTLTIGDVTVTEGNAGTVTATFAVQLNSASGRVVTVNFATAAGSATAGSDFTTASGTLTFAAGELNKTIDVSVTGDVLDEADENFLVNLSGAVNATIGDAQGLGTITDDDATPSITIDDVNVTEGNAGTTNAVFTVTLSAVSGLPVTAGYATSNGTANWGADYTSTIGTLTINPGSASGTISVPIIGDLTDEGDEDFQIALSSPTNTTISDGTGLGTILDDDNTPQATISDATANEGNSGSVSAAFSITLDRPSALPIVLNWSTSDVSAASPADYAAASGSVTFAPGETSKQVSVLVNGDRVDEANETFLVTLSVSSGAVDLADSQATGTINDDDTAGFIISPISGLVTGESGMSANFTVALTSIPTADVEIAISSSDDTEGTVSPLILQFSPDATALLPQTVTINGVDDTIADGSISYSITLSAATSGDPSYNGLNPADPSVSNSDNDTPGITVSPTAGLTTTEAGGTASFSVVLNTSPTANVSISLSSSDLTEGTISTASLLFTPSDALNPQFVTVTGVDDAIIDGSVAYTILTAAAVSADGNYGGTNPSDVSVTNTDDEAQPSISIGDVSIAEGAGGTSQANFTATLSTVSAQTVTVAWASANGTAVSGSDYNAGSGTVTFNPGETSNPISIAVLGDRIDESDEIFAINLSNPVNASISDSAAEGTILDDDTAGITVAPSSGLVTTEAGGQATFTVVLTSVPTADVTIALSSSDTGEGTVAPSSLTFTAADALTPRTVTITGVNDTVIDGNIAFTITTGAASSSDPAYGGIDPVDVSVTNNDNDSAGITVSPTSGLVTTEAGGTAAFTVVLNTTPSADVTIGISSADLTEGNVSVASLTFTSATWNVPQTVTVTGEDDLEADGNISYSIVTAAASSSDANYNGVDAANVSVTNNDNDNAAIIVAPTAGLITTEAGGQATFTIVLSSQPTANVTIALSSSDSSEGAVGPGSITFTPAGWSTPQTITVTGQDDFSIDGNVNYTAVTAAASSSDPQYGGRNASDVSVTNTDDDLAGVVITPTSGLVTSEAGITSTFTVHLRSIPTANVTVNLSSSNSGEGTVLPTSVTRTPANWNVPVTVTVTGVDDLVADGDIAFSIITAAASSADGNYNGLNPADVSVINNDNDVPGITVTPTAGLDTNEGGSIATFRVVLNTQPTATVTIDLSSTNTAEGTVSPLFVQFGTTDWNTPQTVTLTGVDDTVADGDQPYSIVTAPATSADVNYGGMNSSDVAAVNRDNDTPGITVMLSGDLVTTEAGGTSTFRIVLNTTPTADVTIALSTSAAGEGTVGPASITFTPANALIPQTISVAGVDDLVDDGDVPYFIITAAAVSADPSYTSRNAADVAATNLDDDGSGILVTPTSGLITTEAGGTATFTVQLLSPPTANVTIAISSADGTEGSVSPSLLTFTPADALVPQTVTVTGLDDSIDDGDVPYTIITGAAVSADPVYIGLNALDVSATNLDNEGSPSISINDISVVEGDSGTTVATFVVSLSTPTSTNVTVAFATANGTANWGADYVAKSDYVNIPAGASSAPLTIEVVGDLINEASETFVVNLANPVNATIARNQGTGTIIDDDGLPVITSLNPASACQNSDGFTMTVTGTNFVDGASVIWNGAPRTTSFVSGTQLRIEVNASDLTTARVIPITVQNPGGGGASEPKLFTVSEDTEPPSVVAPDAIMLVETTCLYGVGGTSGATSALVSAFLRAGSATDACSTVSPLPPQVNGVDVDDNTFFGGGPTEVTFRFEDEAGRIGTATSTITVELYGDLDRNWIVEAADLVIMANHLVRNIAIGQPPFVAPPMLADLNEDRKIDAVDLTILAHYLVGNITCLPYTRP